VEIRESRGNIVAAMNTIPLPVIAHAARNTPRSNPRVPSTTLALPSSVALQPRRVGGCTRDPRLTRARPLFSTRWSFVDAFLFVIPFVIPLPLFVAHHALLTLSLSDHESRPIKPAGENRSTSAPESRDDDRDDGRANDYDFT